MRERVPSVEYIDDVWQICTILILIPQPPPTHHFLLHRFSSAPPNRRRFTTVTGYEAWGKTLQFHFKPTSAQFSLSLRRFTGELCLLPEKSWGPPLGKSRSWHCVVLFSHLPTCLIHHPLVPPFILFPPSTPTLSLLYIPLLPRHPSFHLPPSPHRSIRHRQCQITKTGSCLYDRHAVHGDGGTKAYEFDSRIIFFAASLFLSSMFEI